MQSIGGETLVARFQVAARQAADASAVIDGEITATYRNLDRRSDEVAATLAARGMGPGSVVGLALGNGLALVSGILGVLKAGAAYLPLDPREPAARMAFMLSDSRAVLVLAPDGASERLSPMGVPILELDAGTGAVRAGSGDGPGPGNQDPDCLVYISYTSGSTGEPKGVAMTQFPLLNMLRWELRRMEVRAALHGSVAPARCRVLHFMRPTFDVSFEEIFAALLAGDCLVAVRDDRRADPQHVLDVVHRHGVERAYLPPMVLAQLAQAAVELGTPPRLWDLVISGGPLRVTPETAQFLGVLDRPVLDDQYGMTEAHQVMGRILSGAPGTWPSPVTLLADVPGVPIHIVDERGQEAADGRGEIYVGGVALSQGYVARPALTAQRFVPDPFSDRPSARLYRTGDVGRRMEDGTILVEGRLDDQIKLRDQRVELGEVETVLAGAPGVAQAAVVPAGEGEHLRLVAYVVPQRHGEPVDAPALRRYLGLRLPEHMIPSSFVLVDALPLSAHGKVNRQLLREWEAREAGAGGELGSTEAAIARIWNDVIGARVQDPRADFFACGGNSLLATRVVASLRRQFGRDVPFGAVLAHPVLADLAAAVDRAALSSTPPLVAVPPDLPVEASFGQQRLWFLFKVAPGSAVYNVAWAARLSGELDEGALASAVREVVRRHEALRTTFEVVDGVPFQRVADELQPCVEVADVAKAEVRGVLAQRHTRPFDLSRGPLHRWVLLRLSRTERILLFCGHHAVLDAWSEEVMRRDLSRCYALRTGRPAPPLPPLTLQYRDYAEWQRSALRSGALDRQLDSWRRQLDGIEGSLPLPRGASLSGARTFAGAARPVRLDRGVATRLRGLAMRRSASLFVVLLSLFSVAVSRWSGAREVVVGIPASGRVRPELEPLVGFFVNSLPIRVDVSEYRDFDQVLARVRQATLTALANQEVPFDRIVEATQPPRTGRRNPLFQVWFDLDERREPLALDGTATAPVELPVTTSPFDCQLVLRHAGGAISGALTYSTELLQEAEVLELASAFEQFASRVANEGAAVAP